MNIDQVWKIVSLAVSLAVFSAGVLACLMIREAIRLMADRLGVKPPAFF